MSPARRADPTLSICIATFRRGKLIGETLDSILGQVRPGVEVVVVDGASPDETPEVVAERAARHPCLRYHREPVNSGVDRDFDKAVQYARGAWCWLMSDDDLLVPGAVDRVLAALEGDPDLVVVNAECRTPGMETVLDERFLQFRDDRVYGEGEHERLFLDTCRYLSYIGGVVIRRATWLARDRTTYYGSLFIHVGVIFQAPPLARARVVAAPLVRIRYGTQMWTPRAFEIWLFKWPALVWSFPAFSDRAKAAVIPREPWRILRLLGLHRAWGGYSAAVYRAHLAARARGPFALAARAIASVPLPVANALVALYCLVAARWARREAWDMAHGPHATRIARAVGRALGV
jgi:glycosyltransferase involved in cell wall biosynthesis